MVVLHEFVEMLMIVGIGTSTAESHACLGIYESTFLLMTHVTKA